MTQINPKHFLYNIAISVQTPYEAGKVISCDPPFWVAFPIDRQYPWKLFLIKNELDIHCFKTVGFQVKFICNSDSRNFCFRNNGEIFKIKHFSSQKNDLIFHIIYQIKVSRLLSVGHASLRIESHRKLRRH